MLGEDAVSSYSCTKNTHQLLFWEACKSWSLLLVFKVASPDTCKLELIQECKWNMSFYNPILLHQAKWCMRKCLGEQRDRCGAILFYQLCKEMFLKYLDGKLINLVSLFSDLPTLPGSWDICRRFDNGMQQSSMLQENLWNNFEIGFIQLRWLFWTIMDCALKVRTIFYLLDSKQTVQHHRLCYGVMIMVLMQVYGFLRKCETTPLTKCICTLWLWKKACWFLSSFDSPYF